MTIAIYARVSSDSHEARGSIRFQLAALRDKVAGLGIKPFMNPITATPEVGSTGPV